MHEDTVKVTVEVWVRASHLRETLQAITNTVLELEVEQVTMSNEKAHQDGKAPDEFVKHL